MTPIQLTLGAGKVDRFLPHADGLLKRYREDTGCDYLDYRPVTSPHIVVPEDLAVTLLVNSQAGWRAFRSLRQHGNTVDLGRLPSKPLESTTQEERRQVAQLITTVAQWPGFAASLALSLCAGRS